VERRHRVAVRRGVPQEISLLRGGAAVLVAPKDPTVTEVEHVRVPAAREQSHSVIRRLARGIAPPCKTAEVPEELEQMSHHIKGEATNAAPKKSAKSKAKKK
jgi:hypothetical protein